MVLLLIETNIDTVKASIERYGAVCAETGAGADTGDVGADTGAFGAKSGAGTVQCAAVGTEPDPGGALVFDVARCVPEEQHTFLFEGPMGQKGPHKRQKWAYPGPNPDSFFWPRIYRKVERVCIFTCVLYPIALPHNF